jgi:iron complex outermembrane recepter protein
MKRLMLAATASIFAMTAAPVWAQDAADEAVGSDDIIVTATRENTLLSKTPIAISAITGEGLRESGIVGPTELGDSIPNLSIDRANGLQITIRGVTSTDGTEKGDPSAAFLLDGVYIARPQQADVSFFDVSRVEVLRGPQGTLYGRNTTAGVVNVITNKPKLGSFSAGANAGYGNFDSINADGYVNIPAGDKVAIRAAASFDQRDNYIRPLATDTTSIDPFRKNFAGRLQVYFEPSDSLNVLLRADYGKLQGSRVAGVRASNFFDFGTVDSQGRPLYIGNSRKSRELRTRGSIALPIPAAVFGGGDTDTTKPSLDNHTYSLEGEINWDAGPVTATYIGSYRRYVAHENQLIDVGAPVGFAATFDGSYRAQSHELRFATSGDGPLKAQAGAYYFREKSGIGFHLLNTPFAATPVFGFPQDPTISKSLAFYAQGTYSLTDAIRLTLGGRYTDDDKSRFGHTVFQQTLTFNAAAGDTRFQNAAAIDGNITNKKFTWRAGLDADVGQAGLAYGSVSTGYKAGGFGDGCLVGVTTQGELCNQVRAPNVLFYQPETLTAYEIGYKDRISDALRVSASIFHYSYKNLQLSQIAQVSGAPSQVTLNAGAAKISGLELEATITPDSNNRVDLAYNYLDAHYSEYCPNGVVANSSACVGGLDYKGRDLDRSPRHVFIAGYSHTFPLGSGGSVVAGVRTRYSGAYLLTNFGGPQQVRNPGQSKTDLSLTFNAAEDRFYVQAYARNLENNVSVNSIDGFNNASPGDPRTYGIRAGFKF